MQSLGHERDGPELMVRLCRSRHTLCQTVDERAWGFTMSGQRRVTRRFLHSQRLGSTAVGPLVCVGWPSSGPRKNESCWRASRRDGDRVRLPLRPALSRRATSVASLVRVGASPGPSGRCRARAASTSPTGAAPGISPGAGLRGVSDTRPPRESCCSSTRLHAGATLR